MKMIQNAHSKCNDTRGYLNKVRASKAQSTGMGRTWSKLVDIKNYFCEEVI